MSEHTLLLIILGLLILFTIYVMVRNNWVYIVRIRLLKNNVKLHEKLPGYCSMLFDCEFWRWDINYYLSEKYQKRLRK
jgi:hypothetical protein